MTLSTLSNLKACYQQRQNRYSDSFRLRIHRALSWLKQGYCEQQEAIPETELDIRFIHLWIAFNAAYANEIDGRTFATDKSDFRQFLQNICQLDTEKTIYHLIWQTFSRNIRIFLNNQYVFQPFWDFHNGKISETSWIEQFQVDNKRVTEALTRQDTDYILLKLFDRIYTLRNQIIHGGATFNSSANRKQLANACHLLSCLIPAMLQIMLQYPDNNWGKPFYPFIKQED